MNTSLPILSLVAALTVSGCARFRTIQKDISTQPDGVTRTIETRASATTFAASKQALAQWKASQTDKTQGASVGSVSQESDATSLLSALITLGKVAAAASQGVPVSTAAPQPK